MAAYSNSTAHPMAMTISFPARATSHGIWLEPSSSGTCQRPEAEYFLEEYRRLSGDDARRRLPPYLRAYVSFRMGWCKMAALASAGSFDEPLLWRDFERYRRYAEQLSGRARSRLCKRAPS